MDAVSYSLASKQAQRIERFIEDPDSTSGIVTVPKTIASGETVTVPAGRVAVLPNIVVDGTLNIDGEVFIPSGSSVDFSNGIKIDGNNIVLSIPTAYHIYNGSVEATNTVVTNGFSTTLYTGNGATQSVNTGVDMSTQWGNDASEMFGGLVWCKQRSGTEYHALVDSVRGATKGINTNSTGAEYTSTNHLTSFNTDGFSIGNNSGWNTNLATYASWNFQTTHRKTGVTNHGKAYTCHYNPFTGFTIIKYTGSGLAGHEIPHSLNRKLGYSTTKSLSSATEYWQDMNYISGTRGSLNSTGAFVSDSYVLQTTDTSTVLPTSSAGYNSSGVDYIMYGWANSYYDKNNTLIGNYEIGVYQGTGASGNKVTTRGKPAWILIKRIDVSDGWNVLDNLRINVSGTNDGYVQANTSAAEVSTSHVITFSGDGFTIDSIGSGANASGGQYLYMVVYDNDSGSGKSKYPKATDTTNLSINALVPYANGIDVNGEKVSISYKNETITGLTLTQGKNYPYSKNDGTYGVNKYAPMYGKLRDRVMAGENPDYFDLETRKWYGTSGGNELITNGTFDTNTTGWTATTATLSISNGSMVITNVGTNYGSSSQTIPTTIGKKYRLSMSIDSGTSTQSLDFTNGGVTSRGYNAVSGHYEYIYDFIAQGSSVVISPVNASNVAGQYSYVQNVSIFDLIPTIGAEITPRTYLDCIAYADQNGQVEYVEELPKIEYVDVIKANEYQGKNACTAWVNFDGTTTPPTIRDSYNVSAVIRIATGIYDVYSKETMDNLKYTVSAPTLYGTSNGVVGALKYLNKVTLQVYSGGALTSGFNDISIQVFGGKN